MIELREHEDNWLKIKGATLNTIGKNKGAYPDSHWKRSLLLSEHSPIRKLKIGWRWLSLKYWVSVHYVRHKFGIEHFITTQRTDRTGENRNEKNQDSPVNHECDANAQALINISRRRLCHCASVETTKAWKEVKNLVREVEPELADCMVRECVYRNGFCPEMFPCGFNKTKAFEEELKEYVGFKKDQINPKTSIFVSEEKECLDS